MTSTPPPTSAQRRRVQWKTIDKALAPYSTESLLVLLEAALMAPTCSRFHDHLLLLWTRVIRSGRRSGAVVTAEVLPVLVEAAVLAAPGRGVLTEGEPNDVRAGVRFAGMLLHPGDLDHPLLVLRSLQLTARAVDEHLVGAVGFGLGDVIELAVRYTDRRVGESAHAWPAPEEDPDGETISCWLTQASVDAVAAAERDCLDDIVSACDRPERARRALDWLTADIGKLKLKYDPMRQLLGPVLAVRAHGRRIPVPASEALQAVTAAAEQLLRQLGFNQDLAQRVQDLAVVRAADVLQLDNVPRPDDAARISAPQLRLEVAVVSALLDGHLGPRVEVARKALLEQTSPEQGRLVVYAGPRFLVREAVTDTLMVHVEELAEMAADASGDPATLALFALEMTQHPGVDAIAYLHLLDAWSSWRRNSSLLAPAESTPEVAVVLRRGRDLSWDRAATWAPIDKVLADAGLPASVQWTATKIVDLPEGAAGLQADLHHYATPTAAVAVSTHPPLAVIVRPSPPGEAPLDFSGLIGLADAVRTTITAHPVIAQHFTLPDQVPITVHLTQALADPAQLPDDRTDTEAPGGLRLLVSVDPPSATIGLVLEPDFLGAFAGDGREGHRALGHALYHCASQVREGRDAGNGPDAGPFTAAWNQANPVLAFNAFENLWPAQTPEYTVPDGEHVQVRALRSAAAAIRKAGVPAGLWRGRDAVRPAEQVLHALEALLATEIRSFEPALTTELARHLNAAWCARTHRHHELLFNMAAPWADNWVQEAQRRTTDDSMATSALNLLLQEALATPPQGDRAVDLLAVAELVALAELILHSGITAVAGARGLHGLEIQVHATGVFHIDQPDAEDPTATATHLGLDEQAWTRARHHHWLAQSQQSTLADLPAPPHAGPQPQRTPAAFTAPRLPRGSSLARADQELRRAWGFGFDALVAVLGTAVDWPTGPERYGITTPEELAREAAVWSGLPASETRAAIGPLILDRGNAADDREHRYTEVERRARLSTHPLISASPGQLLILPWVIHTAQEVYEAAFQDGRLPHRDLPAPVRGALAKHRQAREQQLERDIAAVANRLGLPYVANFGEKDAERADLPTTGGEIDLLIADPATARLWVVEAKHPHPGHAPHAVIQHIKRFTDPKGGYLTKVLRKVDAVASKPQAAALACAAPTDGTWHVVPLIVTQTIDPAAFIADPKVAFTITDYLAQVLTTPADPGPGWWTPPDEHRERS
ncbi:hypothetical protein ABZS86_10895 [Streptomyces sp. NPDC005355]|uniref:hypothetical protein n=1 Tax=Streptomyces sp. NPDC005355 TaxID=3157038 RepID=UPI0033BA105D